LQLFETYRHLINELAIIYNERESQSIAKLLIEAAGFSDLQVSLEPSLVLTNDQYTFLKAILNEIIQGRPVQYVLGKTDFYGVSFIVNEDVLIPRPETEEMVDLIIKENNKENPAILDIGTGSGCIAITLALNLKKANIYAFDISEKALKIAMQNAVNNDAKVLFYRDDILNPSGKWKNKKFDIIVSNPPYVLEEDKREMSPNVLDYEPLQALMADRSDPLLYYRKIFEFSERHLDHEGYIYCEINEKSGREIEQLARSYGFENVRILKDIHGKERIMRCVSTYFAII